MLEPMFKKVKNEKASPFEYSAERSNGIRLSTYKMSDGKRHLSTLKLGEELVAKAGLMPGDKVQLFKTEGDWLLKVDPNGKGLLLAKNSKGSLILRFMWREGFPAIAESDFCKKVMIDRPAKGIRFAFPDGTRFDEVPQKAVEEKEPSEKKAKSAPLAEPLFQTHKRLVERNGAASSQAPFVERRAGGRRAEDRNSH